MKIISALIILLIIAFSLNCCNYTGQDIELNVQVLPKGGLMNGGYGTLRFTVQNNKELSLKAASIIGIWHAGDKKYNSWSYDPGLILEPKEKVVTDFIVWMPPQTEQFAGATIPEIQGKVVFVVGDEVKTIPYRVKVPIAVLESPLVSKRGNFVELLLQDNTWQKIEHPSKVINCLDDAFIKMQELTGLLPFEGDVLVLKECPENPYFGYAGNPIVLNTLFVTESVKCFDRGEVDFGWLYQIGMVFGDEVGTHFNYGTFTSCQANLRVSYALEKMCSAEKKFRIKSLQDGKTLLTGKAFIEEHYLPKGAVYLNDKFRTWESMTSDEYLALMYFIVQQYGWDVIKDFYRLDHLLSENKVQPPEGVERLFLAFAVLDVCCEDDLIPLYQQWRLPINNQTIKELREEYHLVELRNKINNEKAY